MSPDLEDRLRDMYAAVTAQTVVDDPVSPTVGDEVAAVHPTSRSRLFAFAAVAAVVIGAVVFVAVRSRSAEPAVTPPPAVATGDRVFALPGFSLPDGFGLDGTRLATLREIVALGWVDGFPGVPSMPTADEVSAVHWTGPNGAAITMLAAAAPGLQPAPGTTTASLPNGAVVQLTETAAGTAAAWREPNGPLVGVATTARIAEDQFRWLLSNVWTVDRTLFESVATHAGFLSTPDARSYRGFDAWRPPGPDLGVRITMEGSAQWGFHISTGLTGGTSFGDASQCEARTVSTTSTDGRRVLLISNTPIDSFTVHPRDGDPFTVEAGRYPGSARWRYTTVLLPDPPGNGAAFATVTCNGGGS